MARYEYKVVPAPTKGVKAPGIKGSDARVAHALEQVMNQYGADGWEYIRADTLPFEERSRLTRVETKYKNLLVFRRPLDSTIQTWSPAPSPVTRAGTPQIAPLVAPSAQVPETDRKTPPVSAATQPADQREDDENGGAGEKDQELSGEAKAADDSADQNARENAGGESPKKSD